MSNEKRYYWLKFREDFFSSRRIKKLRKMAGGDTYLVIYLKMQLKSLKTGGVLEYTGIEQEFADELALDIDESPDDVRVVLAFLMNYGLCECSDNIHYFLPFVVENTGSETASTQRVRDYRERQKALEAPKQPAKTNAERQSSFRAKQLCEKNGHVPFIEDHMNKKRYNGNYYLCFRRDKCRCAICGSVENLCMHHIDGYDEDKPENSSANKMLTLCRDCHSKVHAGDNIPEEILESIGYFDESNEICNTDVTEVKQLGNAEKEIEKEKELEIEKDNNIAHPKVSGAVIMEQFDAFWKEYPRKKGKGDARKKFAKALTKTSFENIMEALERVKKSKQWNKDGVDFVPYPSTWLNQERWDDSDDSQESDRYANLRKLAEEFDDE